MTAIQRQVLVALRDGFPLRASWGVIASLSSRGLIADDGGWVLTAWGREALDAVEAKEARRARR